MHTVICGKCEQVLQLRGESAATLRRHATTNVLREHNATFFTGIYEILIFLNLWVFVKRVAMYKSV